MALTLIQELAIVSGEVSPPSAGLSALIAQAGSGQALTFSTTHKVFDEAANPEAAAYVNKMFVVGRRIFAGDQEVLVALKRAFASIVGDSGVTYAQVTGAGDGQWATFISANIEQMFEVVSGVKKGEKDAYDAL